MVSIRHTTRVHGPEVTARSRRGHGGHSKQGHVVLASEALWSRPVRPCGLGNGGLGNGGLGNGGLGNGGLGNGGLSNSGLGNDGLGHAAQRRPAYGRATGGGGVVPRLARRRAKHGRASPHASARA